MTLAEIIKKYNISNDVANGGIPGGTDKGSVHSYIELVYEDLFLKYKDKNINFLEVGINEGYSILLWFYYFKNCKNIFGVDLIPNYDANMLNYDKIKIYHNDAYDSNFVKTLPKMDIIIDDGPHSLQSQIDFINNYYDLLLPGGVMIIEDIQHPEYILPLESLLRSKNISHKTLDLRYHKNRYDDIMILIEK